MKRQILILHCGGTIGMGPGSRGFRPLPDFGEKLLTRLQAQEPTHLPGIDFQELTPLVDSANVQPHDWPRMARVLQQAWADYDGFLLLHGTDSLAFSASALSFLLGAIDKPVLLTGSQIPLLESRSDALDNVLNALHILAQPGPLAEVCVYFHGRLLRGNRSVKFKSTALDAFDSPNLPWLGKSGLQVELQEHLMLPAATPAFSECQIEDDAVAVLAFYPGVASTLFAHALQQPGVKAMLIQSYGVGNGPDQNTQLMREIKHASDDGICIATITRCPVGSVLPPTYATGASLAEAGVIGLRDMTMEAAFSKLHVLSGRGVHGQALRTQMPQALRGECHA